MTLNTESGVAVRIPTIRLRSDKKILMPYTLTPLCVATESPTRWTDFANLLREYANTELAEPHLSTIWQDLKDLTARYAEPNGAAVLLYVDDALAGCVAFTSTRHCGTCEVKRLYVRGEFRRHGWGPLLLREVLHRARCAGFTQVVLSTWPDNPKALALYKKLGFVPVPSFKESPGQTLIFLGCDLTA